MFHLSKVSVAESSRHKWLIRVMYAVMILFIISALLRFTINPSGGHAHRQSDTIGMAISFADEVRQSGLSAMKFLLYPKILQRGLMDGINASEFPIFNVLLGFFFLVSANPAIGLYVASLALLIINLLVAWYYLPRLLRFFSVEVSPSIALIVYFTGLTLAVQTVTFMPEGLGFPLIIVGLVEILEAKSFSWRLALGILLCNVAIAAKPTLVVALSVMIIPVLSARSLRAKIQLVAVTGSCVLLGGWWYLFHCKYLFAFEGPQIFAQAAFKPIDRLKEVKVAGLISLLLRETAKGELPMFLGWAFIIGAGLTGEWIVLCIYVTSLIAAVSLDGVHIFIHSYYFIGACLPAIILMARTTAKLSSRVHLQNVAVLIMVWGVLFNVRINFWNWGRDSHRGTFSPWMLGEKARALIGSDYEIVTDDGAYPKKLLLIGRAGAAAGSMARSVCNDERYLSKKIAVVTNDPQDLSICIGRTQEKRVIQDADRTWHISLLEKTKLPRE